MQNQINIPTTDEVLFGKTPTLPINLEVLSQTLSARGLTGVMPRNRPMEHHSFLTFLSQEFEDKLGENVVMEPIIISKTHANTITEPGEYIRKDEPIPLNKLLVNRLVTKIYSPNKIEIDGEEFCPAFAVSYNEKGIEVAYGTNVWACANLNIFGKTRWSTYGTNKISYDDMISLVKAQINQYKERFDKDIEIISKLKESECPIDKQRESVAKLFEIAVQANRGRNKDFILSTGDCIDLQHELLKRRNEGKANTWWDFTQAGTENLKAVSIDMIRLHPTIELFNEWVCEENNDVLNTLIKLG